MKQLLFSFIAGIAVVLLSGLGSQALAQSTCAEIFATPKMTAYETQNLKLAKAYPKFKTMLSDPQKYFNDMTARFEIQKKLSPESPYDFEFSEWALPLFSEMHGLLTIKRAEVAGELSRMSSGQLGRLWNRKKIADIKVGLEFYDLLLQELESHQKKGFVTYRETFELSYFYSRASGLFDISVLKRLNLRDRLTLKLDEYTEGFEEQSVRDELERYRRRDLVLFDKKSPIATWQAAAKPFETAVFDKTKLEVLILPTTEALDRDIFIHLMSSEIYLVGVTTSPIAADGYLRPGSLFFMHDLRHSSFMYYRNLLYRQKYGLTRAQVDELSRMMAEYVEQFDAELTQIADRNLVGAIIYYSFNQHHEGGYHFSPANYQSNNAFHAPFILYAQMKMAGQNTHGFDSVKDIVRARKWVQDFWLKRVASEKLLLEKFEQQNSGPKS
jgi:hypothetical protein